VETAVNALKNSGIPVAAVSTGFPHGLNSMPRRIEEIKDSVAAGAKEIDIVITRSHVFAGDWQALYNEISAFRKACGESHLKTILGTGELGNFRNVAKASLVCISGNHRIIRWIQACGGYPQCQTIIRVANFNEGRTWE
jgi:deoxyribose-phosphate aldolase